MKFENAEDISRPCDTKRFDRIFVHIPKTAGISIKHVLNDDVEKHRCIFYAHPTHAHPPLWKIIKHVGEVEFNRMFKFAIVRNPWDRMVSLYHWLRDNPSMFEHKQAMNLKFGPWLDAVKLNWCLTWPMTEYTHINNIQRVDAILKFENLDKDLKKIDWLPKLEKQNATEHTDFRDYYSASSRRKIEQRYPVDIDMFGYTFE